MQTVSRRKALDGYAEAAITYDGNGKLTEISMLDETGRPVALANGISRWTLDYDDRGNIVGQSVWGLDGGPAWTRVAITAVCCEAQKIGLRAGDIIESYDGREVINHFTLDQADARCGADEKKHDHRTGRPADDVSSQPGPDRRIFLKFGVERRKMRQPARRPPY